MILKYDMLSQFRQLLVLVELLTKPDTNLYPHRDLTGSYDFDSPHTHNRVNKHPLESISKIKTVILTREQPNILDP